jgi:SAM-dependent methyltransferase
MSGRAETWELARTSAEAYERHLVPAIFAPFADRLIDSAALQPGARVVDVACGTGIAARRALKRLRGNGTVVGVDASDEMLDVARVASTGSEPPIQWLVADAADLPLADESVDCVLCQQGLQFFPDPAATLREMRRVLAPGGRLALSVWRSLTANPGFAQFVAVLDRHAGRDVGAIMRAPFSGQNGEELRALAEGAGLRGVRIEIHIEAVRFPSAKDLLEQEVPASPLAEPLAALTPEIRAALADDFEEALRAHGDDAGVIFPMETHVVTATR